MARDKRTKAELTADLEAAHQNIVELKYDLRRKEGSIAFYESALSGRAGEIVGLERSVAVLGKVLKGHHEAGKNFAQVASEVGRPTE